MALATNEVIPIRSDLHHPQTDHMPATDPSWETYVRCLKVPVESRLSFAYNLHTNPRQAYKAVSYTHLDVYKRQVFRIINTTSIIISSVKISFI